MMNDYLWTVLFAQREADLRANARRRGGDTASPGSARLEPVRRFLIGLGLRRPPSAPVTVDAAAATARPVTARPAAARTAAATVAAHEEKAA